jgi:hypothetical protein
MIQNALLNLPLTMVKTGLRIALLQLVSQNNIPVSGLQTQGKSAPVLNRRV